MKFMMKRTGESIERKNEISKIVYRVFLLHFMFNSKPQITWSTCDSVYDCSISNTREKKAFQQNCQNPILFDESESIQLQIVMLEDN